jgi:hypothetical protein
VKASSQWITPLIVKAGRSFVSAKGKDPAEEGAELAEFLRSDEPIGKEERDLLAQLVTGECRANWAGPRLRNCTCFGLSPTNCRKRAEWRRGSGTRHSKTLWRDNPHCSTLRERDPR